MKSGCQGIGLDAHCGVVRGRESAPLSCQKAALTFDLPVLVGSAMSCR